jgi:hypothetical protein
MIRLLTAILLLIYSHFGWAMAYPEDYSGVPHDNFEKGDVIDHTKFNENHSSIKEAINGRVPVPANCSTNQIIRYDGNGWVCADDVLATLNCDVGDRLVRGDNGWECSNSYSVSGNLTGMDSGNSVGLTLNGVSLTMSANGLFTFPNEVEAGQSYTVQVQAQPSNGTETCEVTANGSGNVLAPITDVAVHCYPIAEAYVASFDFMDWDMTNMFDTLTPNIDTSRICDDIVCEFSLANVSDHSNCDISWSGDAATNADLYIDKRLDRVRIDPMDDFQNGQPLTITLSCPSQ